MSFGVGDLVECVDGTFEDPMYGSRVVPNLPKVGSIYTVRGVGIEHFSNGREPLPALWLAEVINPIVNWRIGRGEIGFKASRFRPIRKTSIEIFRQIVANPKLPIRETV